MALEHRVSLVDELLAEQARPGTAVMRFSDWHDERGHDTHHQAAYYKKLIPLSRPLKGEQYAFEVNLDQCTGCKACVAACHSLNGLDDGESWRDMGALTGSREEPYLQTVTTACHHCADPACSNGCPVLAYDKDAETGIVRHLDDQCIGCSYCILKCPYDVPKYNARRGIVRKCDMCHQRLAVGEAPACVQSCPNEAIAIRVVKLEDIRERSTRPGNRMLPTAFDSAYTRPTTTYLSSQPIPASARSQTDGELQLEEPHTPLAWMLVLTQLAAGLFIASAGFSAYPMAMKVLNLSGFLVHAVGLVVSVLHLGQPLRAWRAFLGWRRSWLSREIMAFGAFAKAAALAAVWPWLPDRLLEMLPPFVDLRLVTLAAAGAGLLGVICSAMVYVDTHRPYWGWRQTFPKFLGAMLLLGTSCAAATLRWVPGMTGASQLLAGLALILLLLAAVTGHLVQRRAKANATHPWHLSALKLAHLKGAVLRQRQVLAGMAVALGIGSLLTSGSVASVAAGLSFLATFLWVLQERRLFFTCVTAPRMPGVSMPPPHHP